MWNPYGQVLKGCNGKTHSRNLYLALFIIVLVRFTYRYNVWRSGHVTEQFKLTDVLKREQFDLYMTESTFSYIRALISDAVFDFDVNHLTMASTVDNSSFTCMG